MHHTAPHTFNRFICLRINSRVNSGMPYTTSKHWTSDPEHIGWGGALCSQTQSPSPGRDPWDLGGGVGEECGFISQHFQQRSWWFYSHGMLLFSLSATLRSSSSIVSSMEIRLSKPNKYPSSWLPSTQRSRWLTLTWSGRGFVFPKSIIHTLACLDLSCTNKRELPIIWNKRQKTDCINITDEV